MLYVRPIKGAVTRAVNLVESLSLCPSLAVTTTTTNSRTARLKIDFDILPRVLRSSSSRFFPPAIFLLSRFKREIMVNEEGGRGNGTRSRGG